MGLRLAPGGVFYPATHPPDGCPRPHCNAHSSSTRSRPFLPNVPRTGQKLFVDWSDQVAKASCSPGSVLKIVDALLEVERWLSSDGPDACVITGGIEIWTAGRNDMSDLHYASNTGEYPNPDMSTAHGWDAIAVGSSEAELEPSTTA